MMNREMAERLNIALRTVEVHRAKVMENAGRQPGGIGDSAADSAAHAPSERIKPSSS